MTILEALKYAEQQLIGMDETNLTIYSLLAHTLNLSKEHIWAHPNTLITHDQFSNFSSHIQRAANHEPLAYIIGEKEFYNLPFYVTQDVLIPRPESEKIIEIAREFIDKRSAQLTRPLTIVDVGTGSGCLAITLASLNPRATIYAIDISEAALKVAQRNAVRHSATNVTFLQGSLLEPLQQLKQPLQIDIVMANLPYISNVEFDALPQNIRQYEPEIALRSYRDDPDFLNRQLIRQLKDWLTPQGKLVYETTNGKIVQLDADQLV